jgi:hypothetical protein
MRRSQRLIAAAVLISLAGVLAGCSSGFDSWDPSDLLDWLDTKKKLPGKREPVFPDGVPGLEQGVPKELYKSEVEKQQQEEAAQAAAAAAQPTTDQPPAADQSAGKSEAAKAATPPAPKHKKVVRHKRAKPVAASDAAAAQPAQAAPAPTSQPAQSAQQQSPPPFPAPLPSGSFSH